MQKIENISLFLEITKLHLQNAQDAARQVEMEVSERLLVMENEYQAKLGVFEAEKQSVSTQQEEIEKLKKENTRLKEVCILEEMRFKKEFEQVILHLCICISQVAVLAAAQCCQPYKNWHLCTCVLIDINYFFALCCYPMHITVVRAYLVCPGLRIVSCYFHLAVSQIAI